LAYSLWDEIKKKYRVRLPMTAVDFKTYLPRLDKEITYDSLKESKCPYPLFGIKLDINKAAALLPSREDLI
jgi:hypothetical protein